MTDAFDRLNAALAERYTVERELGAGGVSYAHSHGVVHHDIKPENVLLSADEAVVADSP